MSDPYLPDDEFFIIKGPQGYLADFDWSVDEEDALEWTSDHRKALPFDLPQAAASFILEEFQENGGDPQILQILGFWTEQTSCTNFPFSLPSA